MTTEGRAAAAAEELARADEELRCAEGVLLAGFARIALTRAYFACFHAVRAALYTDNHEPRSHQGALHLFNLHFVKTGRFPIDTSRLLARLQKFREEADYSESFVIDAAGAGAELAAARGFVERVRGSLPRA